jgi:hypothetical protein
VEADVPDQLAPLGEDDPPHEPWPASGLLAHLPEAEGEKAAVVLVGPVVRDHEAELVVAAVQEGLDQLRGQPDQLEPLARDRLGHASGPRRKIRPIEGR